MIAALERAPWTTRDVIVAAVLNLAALGLIVAGYAWSSGRTAVADQFAALNLTLLGLILAGAGNIALLLSGRRAIGRAKRRLFGSPGDGE